LQGMLQSAIVIGLFHLYDCLLKQK